MSIFGKLEINLPFLQAIKLPPLSKFIKDFIAGKAKGDGKIIIGENVSDVIQKKLPSKCTDPGVFSLPICIGNVRVEHAMCDLGASINVMPLSVYNQLTGVELVETRVVIQLADRSCICPEGVLENVLVKVHDFLYPADFYVLRMSGMMSKETGGVLLGRPFLRTAKTIINVSDGTICLDYHGDKFTFSIEEAMKKPLDTENACSIDVIDPPVQEFLERADKEAASWCDLISSQGLTDEEITTAIMEFCKKSEFTGTVGTDQLNSSTKLPSSEDLVKQGMEKNPLPSSVHPPKTELKVLPPALKYVYLGE